jgi:hypothetical protein
LHYEKPWEKLAEDPFRGLRAGPAIFSPSLLPMVTRNASGAPTPPKHPELPNTAEVSYIEEKSKTD